MHIAVFLAGFTGILGRLIQLNEGLLVWYRLLISAATMWGLYLFLGRIQRISFTELLKITGVGFIAALHWVTFYGAIKYANVSVALVCFSAVGFFTALFEPVILKKPWNKSDLLLGLLVIGGIFIIFQFDTRFKTGILTGLLSAVLGSLFPIYNRQFLKRMNVETLITYELTGGLVLLTLFLPLYLHYLPAAAWFPDAPSLGWLLVLSWVCSVLAFQLSSNALKHVTAFTVNLTYNLEPVYGIVLAFLIFGENKYLGTGFYIGFGVIAIALVIHLVLLIRTETRLVSGATGA